MPLTRTEARSRGSTAQFSPDGRWVAYQSNESGRFEIYLQSFPVPSGKTLISVGGGVQARWGGDGRELFYISLDNRLMTVPLDLGSDRTVRAGSPVELFAPDLADGPVLLVETTQYVVADDGQRFLMNSSDVPSGPITILLNWVPQR